MKDLEDKVTSSENYTSSSSDQNQSQFDNFEILQIIVISLVISGWILAGVFICANYYCSRQWLRWRFQQTNQQTGGYTSACLDKIFSNYEKWKVLYYRPTMKQFQGNERKRSKTRNQRLSQMEFGSSATLVSYRSNYSNCSNNSTASSTSRVSWYNETDSKNALATHTRRSAPNSPNRRTERRNYYSRSAKAMSCMPDIGSTQCSTRDGKLSVSSNSILTQASSLPIIAEEQEVTL